MTLWWLSGVGLYAAVLTFALALCRAAARGDRWMGVK